MANHFEIEQDGQAFSGTPKGFKDRCYTFLVILCNDKDMDKAAQYLHPDCILVHGDNAPVHGAAAFIAVWKQNLTGMPGYHKDIRDIIVEMDKAQDDVARVWVYSRIAGIENGKLIDSIDMMHFTADGLFLDSKDIQRTVKTSL